MRAQPNLAFNQYLVVADEPLLFHAGLRQMFPLVSEAVGRIMPVDQLRWVTFGHVEADEMGSMNDWLAAAPVATVAHGATAVTSSTAPTMRRLADLEVSTMALMHGPAYTGDSSAALRGLADHFETVFTAPS